jgi:hypothetical protein
MEEKQRHSIMCTEYAVIYTIPERHSIGLADAPGVYGEIFHIPPVSASMRYSVSELSRPLKK